MCEPRLQTKVEKTFTILCEINRSQKSEYKPDYYIKVTHITCMHVRTQTWGYESHKV